MVGVRSRRGCALCKKRKIKCDEAIPSCQKCVSRGKKCPGYYTGFIFQDETERLTKAYETSSTDSNREKTDSPRKEVSPPPSVQATLTSRKDRLSWQLISSFYGAVPEGKRLDTIAMYFLPFIPSRLGYSRALDDAVDCLTSAHRCLLVGQIEMPRDIFRKYGCALRSLKNAVENPSSWTTNETLCATQLLTLFEAMTSNVAITYVLHADGTARLIEARGPKGFHDDFGHAMLASCRYSIWGSCVVQGKPSYFTSRQWRECMLPTEYELSVDDYAAAQGKLFTSMAAVPEMLARFLDSFEADFSIAKYDMLLRDIYRLRDSMIELHHEWSLMYGVDEYTWPSTFTVSDWEDEPPVRTFASYWVAQLECMHWAALIPINRLIIYLAPHTSTHLVRQNKELAEAICGSYAYCRQDGPLKGIWISACLTWALYEFRNEIAKRRWITKALVQAAVEWKFCTGELKQAPVETKLKNCILALYTELEEGPDGPSIRYREDLED